MNISEYLVCKCNVCKEYLAHSMYQPLRCGGIHYENGLACANSGKPWKEIVEEHDLECDQKRLAYWKEHKQHLEMCKFYRELKAKWLSDR